MVGKKRIGGFEVGFIIGMILFPIFFTLVVPYIHESWHIFSLESFDCDYNLKFGYSLEEGLTASTTFALTECNLNDFQTSIVYLAGVSGNLLLGILLFFIIRILAKRLPILVSTFMIFIVLSFLTSTSINFFYDYGDPLKFLNLIEKQNYNLTVYSIGVLIVLLSFFLFYEFMNHIIEIEIESEFKKPVNEL